MCSNKTYVLCDGNCDCNNKENGCFLFGGECCHTTDTRHALNTPSKRRFIYDNLGNKWEVEVR